MCKCVSNSSAESHHLNANVVVCPGPSCRGGGWGRSMKSLFSIVTLLVMWLTLYTLTRRAASSNMLFRSEMTMNWAFFVRSLM